jgi:hypothetical protein
MHLKISKALITGLFIFTSFSLSSGNELKTRYATIVYSSEEQLRTFNKEISLGGLSYLLRSKRSIAAEEEIKNKLDVIIERVETILGMFPNEVKFTVSLLSDDEVQRMYRSRYGTSFDYIAFYSPRDKTVFVSVKDIDTGVLAHEIAHVIIDLFYGIATPAKIHEVLAQYVETHLKD